MADPSDKKLLHVENGQVHKASPLSDVSNKLRDGEKYEKHCQSQGPYSPQTELSTKLQQTSITNGLHVQDSESQKDSVLPNLFKLSVKIDQTEDKKMRNKLATTNNVRHSKQNKPATEEKIVVQVYEEKIRVSEEDLAAADNKGGGVDSDLPDHFIALIKAAPILPGISQLRKEFAERNSSMSLKRVAGDVNASLVNWQTSKKIKGHLQSIKENCTVDSSDISRLRSGSAPVPVKELTVSVSVPPTADDFAAISITPTKQDTPTNAVVENGSSTPIRVSNRQRPHQRSLSNSHSMLSLDLVTSHGSSLNASPSNNFVVGSSSPYKTSRHSLEFRADDVECPLLIGDWSKKCLLSCRLYNGVPLADSDEVAKLLEGHYSSEVERVFVIDCRFPYEFKGGHIKGALNFPHPYFELLKSAFFEKRNTSTFNKRAAWIRPDATSEQTVNNRVIVIFHCEFSSHRAPKTFQWFRNEDRNGHTIANYPKLDYPEAYVLRGGYKAFVKYCSQSGKLHLCDPPGGYTEQRDPRFVEDLRQFHRRIKTMSDIEDCLSLGSLENSPPISENDIAVPERRSQPPTPSKIVTEANECGCASSDSEEASAQNVVKNEFDDDHFKSDWLKREMGRRRSDCPRSFMSAIGRASFEELTHP